VSDLLIDSHAMLWFFWDDPQLSHAAKAAIEDPANRKLVSIASCWEIAIKVGQKKLDLGATARAFLIREMVTNNFNLLQISLDHATSVQDLANHHKDPFDRLLTAQALCENIPIVSGDTMFDRYGVSRIW
jgi:PIN domain nuclease of toxin-antitoxin system